MYKNVFKWWAIFHFQMFPVSFFTCNDAYNLQNRSRKIVHNDDVHDTDILFYYSK